jgi:Holliday junction DNA helicase RuvA
VIAHLQGQLLRKTPQEVVVDVSGVGYKVAVPVSTFLRLGDLGGRVTLRIHTHVREDALQLFGFLTPAEQEIFEHLISVSGVGPKLAVNILSGIEASDLHAALKASDLARLTRVPGVGKKTAERLVVELKDKLPPVQLPESEAPAPAPGTDHEDLLSALTHLGYSRHEAERAVERAARETPEARFEDLLRRALQLMAVGR